MLPLCHHLCYCYDYFCYACISNSSSSRWLLHPKNGNIININNYIIWCALQFSKIAQKLPYKYNYPNKKLPPRFKKKPRWLLPRILPRCLSTPRRVAKKRSNGRRPPYGICPQGCWTRATWVPDVVGVGVGGWVSCRAWWRMVVVEGGLSLDWRMVSCYWTCSSVSCCLGVIVWWSCFAACGVKCWCVWGKVEGQCWSNVMLVAVVMASALNLCSTHYSCKHTCSILYSTQ